MTTADNGTPVSHGSPSADGESGLKSARTLARGDISLIGLINIVLRHRGRIVAATGGVVAAIVVLTFLGPPSYTATASFAPQTEGRQASRLAGLASQFGISVPTGEMSVSPQFYADLLLSRRLLEETSLTTFKIDTPDGGGKKGSLLSLLRIDKPTRERRVAAAVERLRKKIVSVSTDDETGVVKLSVTTSWPELSARVADRMIELVNRFNLERRQSQAEAERKFLEARLSQARAELRAAEDSLEQFLQTNRRYQESPTLRFEYQRLQRRVSQQQEVHTSLAQSYEQARIEEVRNTPVITVVDPAQQPATPDDPEWLSKILVGLFVGLTVGLIWAFGREVFSGARVEAPEEYAEFSRLKESIAGDWRRALARLKEIMT